MTSLQTGLPGIGKSETQIDMLGEFTGKDGKKEKLIDIEAYWRNYKAGKPLEGQQRLGE